MNGDKKLNRSATGKLYIVATPIGNLEDITFRAVKTLKEVDVVLCEDKRVTAKLFSRYGINTKLLSCHKFNEAKRIDFVLSVLESSKNIALVTDAGTPLISDPGLRIVSLLREKDIKIIPIPGPSSVISALSVCPFNKGAFFFSGYLPEEKSKRESLFKSLNNFNCTVVFFIPPHDFKKYLIEINNFYSDVELFYAREITKYYEECWNGSVGELIDNLEKKNVKGEIVLCLNFNDYKSKSLDKKNLSVQKDVFIFVKKYINKGYSLKQATKAASKELNISSNELYNAYVKALN